MTKLQLVAAPTFKASVLIPVAGSKPVPVEFIFKHRTRTQLTEFATWCEGKTDVEIFLELVSGWNLEDAFSAESAALLLENYPGASLAVYRAYYNELTAAKLGN